MVSGVSFNKNTKKISTFCFAYEILGHSEAFCPAIFDKGVDDGRRDWSIELRDDLRGREVVDNT